jgi:6-pyruvoyl-tetrahydropterin synthase
MVPREVREGSLTSFTSSSFDASHRGPFANEIHGHTWFVEIGWKGPAHGPRVNAIEMKAKLDACLDQWDHKVLDDIIEPTNEGVAQAVGEQIAGLSEVTVWRKGRVPCRARWINNNERGQTNARAHRQEMETDRDGGSQ